MNHKTTGEQNSNQNQITKYWRGEPPQIVDGILRVEIDDVLFYPKLIGHTHLIFLEGGIQMVWIYFKMGRETFQSKGYVIRIHE